MISDGLGRFSFLNPMICPTMPPGLGTGHSRFGLLPNIDPSSDTSISCVSSLTAPASLRFLLYLFPSGVSKLSAYCRLSAGHGSKCGAPTTRNEMNRVAVKSVLVDRERG